VQIVYEFNQRPEEKRHAPWLERVTAQAKAAYGELERTAAARKTTWLQGESVNASDVVVAVTWRFGQYYNEKYIASALYPALVAHSQRAEALAEFASTPLPDR
jgi:glutathione S-transferase